jgi:hypothetical protein
MNLSPAVLPGIFLNTILYREKISSTKEDNKRAETGGFYEFI